MYNISPEWENLKQFKINKTGCDLFDYPEVAKDIRDNLLNQEEETNDLIRKKEIRVKRIIIETLFM